MPAGFITSRFSFTAPLMNLAKNRECAQLHREMNSLSSTVNQRKRCRGKRKQHISGYEPFYLIADTELPNAKFQASIKHQASSINCSTAKAGCSTTKEGARSVWAFHSTAESFRPMPENLELSKRRREANLQPRP